MKKFIRLWQHGKKRIIREYKISEKTDEIILQITTRKGVYEKGYIVKPYLQNKHIVVNLYIDGTQRNYKLHRLIYGTFVGKIKKHYDIHHKDNNQLNNDKKNFVQMPHGKHSHLTNFGRIHRGQPLENMRKAHAKGFFTQTEEWKKKQSKKMQGEKHPQALFTLKQVREIRKVYNSKNVYIATLAELHTVSPAVISGIVHNQTYKERENDEKPKGQAYN